MDFFLFLSRKQRPHKQKRLVNECFYAKQLLNVIAWLFLCVPAHDLFERPRFNCQTAALHLFFLFYLQSVIWIKSACKCIFSLRLLTLA